VAQTIYDVLNYSPLTCCLLRGLHVANFQLASPVPIARLSTAVDGGDEAYNYRWFGEPETKFSRREMWPKLSRLLSWCHLAKNPRAERRVFWPSVERNFNHGGAFAAGGGESVSRICNRPTA
jgi:hypothetical protein